LGAGSNPRIGAEASEGTTTRNQKELEIQI